MIKTFLGETEVLTVKQDLQGQKILLDEKMGWVF